MLEFYYREIPARIQIRSIRDETGKEYPVDESSSNQNSRRIGSVIDWTDDRQDPHKGIRLEYLWKTPLGSDSHTSKFYVQEYNATFYIPLGDFSTWAFNYYESHATVTEHASTDRSELEKYFGLDCPGTEAPEFERTECERIENERLDMQIALNKYGQTTGLGGTQRLRSYPAGRFTAGHARFVGTELRWNLTNEYQKFDYFIMKGVRTSFQLAFFTEWGSVGETLKELDKKYYNTYGVGFRLLFEGTTVRADLAHGDEGINFQFFIQYPWGLNAVDGSTR